MAIQNNVKWVFFTDKQELVYDFLLQNVSIIWNNLSSIWNEVDFKKSNISRFHQNWTFYQNCNSFFYAKIEKNLKSKVGCLFLICRQTLKKLKNTENMRFNDIKKDFLN